MTNVFVMQVANGNAFFAGLILVILASICRLAMPARPWRVGARITALIGTTLVAASATPLPAWAYLGWLVLFVAAFALEAKFLPHRGAVGVVLALILFSVAMYAHELGYRRAPIIPIHHGQTVYVIGDSISAGIGKEKPWPKVLQETHGINVVNLARAGATVRTALGQLPGLNRSKSVVILEIGGNDLLGATRHSDFASALDCLLGTLAKQGHTLVMFELPQLLFLSDVGRTQRMLARKYNAILLPKTYMTQVFSMPGATLDGLHLSEAGHRAMAESIFQSISP